MRQRRGSFLPLERHAESHLTDALLRLPEIARKSDRLNAGRCTPPARRDPGRPQPGTRGLAALLMTLPAPGSPRAWPSRCSGRSRPSSAASRSCAARLSPVGDIWSMWRRIETEEHRPGTTPGVHTGDRLALDLRADGMCNRQRVRHVSRGGCPSRHSLSTRGLLSSPTGALSRGRFAQPKPARCERRVGPERSLLTALAPRQEGRGARIECTDGENESETCRGTLFHHHQRAAGRARPAAAGTRLRVRAGTAASAVDRPGGLRDRDRRMRESLSRPAGAPRSRGDFQLSGDRRPLNS